MSKKRIVHLAYGITLSLVLFALAICFIVCTLKIYQSGLHPYTSERIGQYFGYIAPLVFITLALILGGVILNIAYPLKKEKLKSKITKRQSLSMLYDRFDKESFEDGAKEKITHHKYLRITLYTIDFTLLVVTSILALVYLLNPSNYPLYDENGASATAQNAIKGTLVMVRYLILPFIFTIATSVISAISVKKELEIVKSQAKTAKKRAPVDENAQNHKNFIDKIKCFFETNEKTVTIALRVVIITVALTLLISGIAKGGLNNLLDKATAICKECIGMG